MKSLFKGVVHKYGDNIDTDVIIPARYLSIIEPEELSKHCLEGLDKDFVARVSSGDFLVAGDNFGCGSSREHAAIAIKACGISAIIAKSFARIFFRNAINIGLTVVECPEFVDAVAAGDLIEVDLQASKITILNKSKTFQFKPLPAFLQEILSAGGLVEWVKSKLFKQAQNYEENR